MGLDWLHPSRGYLNLMLCHAVRLHGKVYSKITWIMLDFLSCHVFVILVGVYTHRWLFRLAYGYCPDFDRTFADRRAFD